MTIKELPFASLKFRRQAYKFAAINGVRIKKPLSLTKLWETYVLTKNGTQWSLPDDFQLFFMNPPIDQTRVKTSGGLPIVLAVGTSAELRALSEEQIKKKVRRYGFKEIRVVWSSEAANFWGRFFGHENYLDQKIVGAPDLILATGVMRGHDCLGTGMTIDVRSRLKKIGSEWGIPVKRMKSPCY